MKIATIPLLLVCMMFGCSQRSDGGEAVVPPFDPPSPIGAPVVHIGSDGAITIDPTDPGFVIGVVGDQWRASWVGSASQGLTSFRGYVYTPATFLTSTPGCSDGSCALEAGDVVSLPNDVLGGGQEILFDTAALDGPDGFDFTVDSTTGEPVVLYLEVQYQAAPQLIRFASGSPARPPSLPIGLTQ
jgi:hypothetical protein